MTASENGLAYPIDRQQCVFFHPELVPLGFLLVGETVRGGQPVEHLGDGVIELPYWLYLLLC